MASSNPNQQYPYAGGTGQPHQELGVNPADDQTYSYGYQYQAYDPTMNYVQAQYGSSTTAPPIAELPAPLPPAPPTSTSQRQLDEDEQLARKLSQIEIEEARRRSSGTLSHRPSQYSLGASPSPSHSPQIPQGSLHQSTQARLHSRSISSLAPPVQSSSGQPSNLSNSSLLPEVVSGPHRISFHGRTPGTPSVSAPIPLHSPILPEVVAEQRHHSFPVVTPYSYTPVPHSTTGLPPAPTDPASLSAYLECHRQVPYPPQWILPPVISTLYASFTHAPTSNWLDLPISREWRTDRFTRSNKDSPPAFAFTFKSKGGNYRDPRFSWTLTPSPRKDKVAKSHMGSWTYHLRIDLDTGVRKSELLTPPTEKDLITTYIHAPNYDSLRFVGPEGRLYMWVANAPLSSVNGSRYDTLRHALFASTQDQTDPLYGEIIADHTYWDGFVDYSEVHTDISCGSCGASPIHGLRWKCKLCVDHDVCESCKTSGASIKGSCSFTLVALPDEVLYVRSPNVDPALVVATLQIMKDWELHTLRKQKRRDPEGFKISEDAARKLDLGRISYWRASDFEGNKGLPSDGIVHGTVVKVHEVARTGGMNIIDVSQSASKVSVGHASSKSGE